MNTRRLATAATLTALAIGGSAVAVANASASGTDSASTTTSSSSTTSPTTSSTTSSPTLEPSAPATTALSADEAASIALGRVGGGQVRGIEAEFEHGRMEWKVEVVNGGRTTEVRVDATTGAITRIEGSDDRGGDDRGGDDDSYDDSDDRGDDKGGEKGDDNSGRH